jgi:hypothetical protein
VDRNRIPKQALQCRPTGHRDIGQPRKRWRDQLHLEVKGAGLHTQTFMNMMMMMMMMMMSI